MAIAAVLLSTGAIFALVLLSAFIGTRGNAMAVRFADSLTLGYLVLHGAFCLVVLFNYHGITQELIPGLAFASFVSFGLAYANSKERSMFLLVGFILLAITVLLWQDPGTNWFLKET